jgi:hypothetical protein
MEQLFNFHFLMSFHQKCYDNIELSLMNIGVRGNITFDFSELFPYGDQNVFRFLLHYSELHVFWLIIEQFMSNN